MYLNLNHTCDSTDAQHVDLGLIIPEPFHQPSSTLGDVIYVDNRGILRKITNMFKPTVYMFGRKALALNLPPTPEVREETSQRILAVATDGVRLRRIKTERYTFPFSSLIDMGVIDNENLLPADCKPLRAYEIETEPGHSGPGKVCIAGPGMRIRRLVIDEQIVRDWVRENQRVIESHRVNRQSPRVMVVPQECRSNTWVGLAQGREKCQEDESYIPFKRFYVPKAGHRRESLSLSFILPFSLRNQPTRYITFAELSIHICL